MIPQVPLFIPQPFAQNGERHEIPANNTTPGSPDASWNLGFPPVTGINKAAGGKPPTRLDFQGILHTLSQHVFYLQSGGLYPWQGATDDFPGLNYIKGARVQGSDGKEYIARKASGPDVMGANGAVGPVDPVTDSNDFWRDAEAPNYPLLEFQFFRHPDLPEGFEALDGGVIENGAEMYPEAWAKLQTTWGQKLCKTAAERVELANHIYYTLADGTPITYGGIGGVPFFTIDTATGEIVMPDIRGQHLEAAGFDSLNVGHVAIDAIRRLRGYSQGFLFYSGNTASGIISVTDQLENLKTASNTGPMGGITTVIDSGFTTPYGTVNRPRSFGILACAFMGQPAL